MVALVERFMAAPSVDPRRVYGSAALLRNVYAAAGASPEKAADLVRYTESGNAAFGPTYEDQSILR